MTAQPSPGQPAASFFKRSTFFGGAHLACNQGRAGQNVEWGNPVADAAGAGRGALPVQRRFCAMVVWGEWRLGSPQRVITTSSSNLWLLWPFRLSLPCSIQLAGNTVHLYTRTIMANNSRYYYSLPTQAPQSRSGSRRPPLTPSTVSSPCVSTHAPIASRRDSGSGSPTKASALLAKVASHPATPRGDTPTTSPAQSPDTRSPDMHSNPMYSPERPAVWRSESARYVHQYRQQGKRP